MALPEVASREQWLEARLALLAEEKELTRRRDALNAARRSLPMVKVEKDYVFDGPRGPVTLTGLFGSCRQLVVHHVMFGPDWDSACPVCTEYTSELTGALITRLRSRDTAFAMVCRAPLAKIDAYTAGRGWACRGTPATAATSTTTSRSPWISRSRSWTTTTGQNQACSATRRQPKCRARAASCATATRSSTPTRPTPAAWTTSTSPTPSWT